MYKLLEGAEDFRIHDTGKIERLKLSGSNKNRRIDRKLEWVEVQPNLIDDVPYPRITINGVHYYVHRLVASMFLPIPTTAGMHVHHKDEDTLNCNANNLEWKTPVAHRGLHLLKEQKHYTTQENRHRIYLNNSTVDMIDKKRGVLSRDNFLINILNVI